MNRVPNVTFQTRVRDTSMLDDNPFRWQEVTTAEIFNGRRVLVFSLPGAFTPTCSTYQVPGFVENRELIKSLGIDEIYVISVNDTFVMRKWMIDQDALDKIGFIPDGSGKFTRCMGMLVDKDNLGFGMRSWRYAMVVDNGEIEQMFVEPGFSDNCETDPYGETSPDTVIAYFQERQNESS